MVIGYRLLVMEFIVYCLLFNVYCLMIITTKFEKYEESRNKKT